MSLYRIGSFNCKNFIYDNNPEKFELIKEIIQKTKIHMLLLQEFAASDKNAIALPINWDIELYHGKWYKKDFKNKVSIISNLDIDPENDTNKEYMRNPNNDNGYAILWDTSKFIIKNFEDNRNIKNLLLERNHNTKIARPPQIEYFCTTNNNNNIFAVMNTHLTFKGEFKLILTDSLSLYGAFPDDLYIKPRIVHDYNKASKEVKSRVNEMSELLKLYDSVNNQGSLGVHYTTILGGDFNLAQDYLQVLNNAPADFPATTTAYNDIKRNDATEQYNKIYAENSNKTTLHKVYKEDPLYDYKYHSYDHFIINQEGCKTEVFDSVKCLKSFFDESKGDKSPRNDEHYNKLSDHLPVVITVNL